MLEESTPECPQPSDGSRQPLLRIICRVLRVRLAALALLALLALLVWGDFGFVSRATISPNNGPPQPTTPTADDWPNRRGPNYDAVSAETDLVGTWPSDGPPVLWIREIGRGYSGFVVVAERAYTQIQTLTAQYVECLDGDSGSQIWQHRYAWPFEPAGMYPGPRSTPTWNAGRIYFAGPAGLVGCLDARDGTLLWQLNADEKFHGRGTSFGYSCSPLVEDGKVILPVGGQGASVVALDVRDGSTVWATGNEPASYCSALPITFEGRRCVVAYLQNALVILDLETGRELCMDNLSFGYDEHAAAPLYEEPYLVIARPFRAGAICFRLKRAEPADETAGPGRLALETVWQNRELSNDTASSVLVDGNIYGFDIRDVQAKAHRPSRGSLKCLDLKTGETRWQTDRVGHSTVLAADGKLILFTDEGELILAQASHERYEELARTKVFDGEICWTAPSLAGGRLYLRSPTRAACVYVGPPERLDASQRRSARPATEIPRASRLDLTAFVGGEREYAFDPARPDELWLWYKFSMVGVLGVAAILAAAARLAVQIRRPSNAPSVGRSVFWTAAFVLGVFGTPVFNRWTGSFVFTWPVCLFVAHQVALNTIIRTTRLPVAERNSWLSTLVTCGFVATCVAYFLVCRRLSLATEWIFLIGFLPSWPMALPAAYRLNRKAPLLADFIWIMLAFSAFFWSAGGYLIWKGATA